jgi:3-hydroxyisobutyrate dehydrogenase-like beta-hydroxyacid dehydrogenase
MSESPIGLIGAGLLGTALAERMLAGGLGVLGYDRESARLEHLRHLGGQAAESSADVARQCAQIVLCLPDTTVVKRVLDELAMDHGVTRLLIDATTGDPDESEALGAELDARGIGYVDATIAGSSEQARRGEAVVIVGGALENVKAADPVLVTWSQRRFHVGGAGSGQRMKLVVNLVLGLNRAVLAEGLNLAAAAGMDSAATLEILRATPAYSAIMDSKGPKMVKRDFAPQARLAQHLKDVRLIRELGARHQAMTPLTGTHERLLLKAVELGFGEADNSAVIQAFRQ